MAIPDPIPSGTITTVIRDGHGETATIINSRPSYDGPFFEGYGYQVDFGDETTEWVSTDSMPDYWTPEQLYAG